MRMLLDLLRPRAAPALSAATVADAAAAAAIHAASFARGWSEDEMAGLLAAKTTIADRASVGRRLAGFILSRLVDGEAEILSVAVATRFRGRRIAGKLLDRHLRRLAGEGVRVVFLEVEESNTPARRLYSRFGFREVGRRSGYYRQGAGAPSNALVLRRDLASA